MSVCEVCTCEKTRACDLTFSSRSMENTVRVAGKYPLFLHTNTRRMWQDSALFDYGSRCSGMFPVLCWWYSATYHYSYPK